MLLTLTTSGARCGGRNEEAQTGMSDKACGKLIGIEGQAGDEMRRRLNGATLLTAEVLYYMPDHPKLLQTFLWQTLDEAPTFPRLTQFLDYWRREIEAVIHSVRVAHGQPLDVPGWRQARGIITMN
jgi:uncharacterized protein Usg